MAKKIEMPDPQDDDLVILNPNQTITIAGEKITVREYGFVEGLQLRPLMKPLLDSLYQVKQDGRRIDQEALLDVVVDHTDLITQLIAKSTDQEPDWVRQLNDADGSALFMAWWGVCGPFFVRKLSDRLMTEMLQRQAERKALAGATFSPPSSPQDTIPTE